MKVSCPNCQRVLQAPDEWGGRTVKCPSCKKPIALPKGDAPEDLGIEFGSLESLEGGGEAVISDRRGKPMKMKEAQAAAVVAQQNGPPVPLGDPLVRACPKCGQKVRTEDV